MWWRSRMLGGRTNHWARNSFRMGEYDFKPFTRDGLGVDWPIEYKDLAPWYDKTEKLVGVYGTNTGLENHPSSGPGVLLPPPKFRVWETFLKAGGDAIGIPVAGAPGDPHLEDRRALAMLLGVRLRPRLRHRRGVPDHHVAHPVGQGHRQAHHRHRRHGVRSASRCDRKSHWRALHRQGHGQAARSQGPRRHHLAASTGGQRASCSTRSPMAARKVSPIRAGRSAAT